MNLQARGRNGKREPDDGDQDEATTPGARAPSSRGFSAQLRGVSLWDLVQMECLARSRLVVQVVGEGGVGYLYFDHGSIVHATTAIRAGEAAALEILSWTNGSFQPSERPWPDQGSIATPHEALILQAAQIRDEGNASNLVAFPGRSAAPSAVRAPTNPPDAFEDIELVEEEGGTEMTGSDRNPAPLAPKGAGGAGAEVAGDFSVLLRLGSNGAVVSNRGGSEVMAETVAYAQRLLQLAGEILGLEPFSAIECAFLEERGRCIVFTEGEGETVALRPRPTANLQPLRERLGL